MKPSEVPDEVVSTTDEVPVGAVILRSERAAIIAAAWPEIEKRVREQVAAEIEAAAPECTVLTGAQTVHRAQGMHDAARIARGEPR